MLPIPESGTIRRLARRGASVLLPLFALLVPPTIIAQSFEPPGHQPFVVQQNDGDEAGPPRVDDRGSKQGLSLDDAAALVRQRTGGRVVRTDSRENGGRLVYEIRVLTDDGRVRTYRVDAATGAMR